MGQIFHKSFFAMGTRFNIVIPFYDEVECERILRFIIEEVVRIENKLSFYKPDSWISVINKKAFEQPVPVDEEMFSILKTCLQYSEFTFGAFNIASVILKDFWKSNPSALLPDDLISALSINQIELDEKNLFIKFKNIYPMIFFLFLLLACCCSCSRRRFYKGS